MQVTFKIDSTEAERAIKEFGVRGEKVVWDSLRYIASIAGLRLIASTPILTSRARMGWAFALTTLGISFTQYVHAPGIAYGSSEGFYQEKRTPNNMYISLINKVPYITLLEKGRSRQAPQGIISKAQLARLQTQAVQIMDSDIRAATRNL